MIHTVESLMVRGEALEHIPFAIQMTMPTTASSFAAVGVHIQLPSEPNESRLLESHMIVDVREEEGRIHV
jgi:hypothetical protein